MNNSQLRSIKNRLAAMIPSFTRRVAPLYVALDWKWFGGRFDSPDHYIPSERDIRTTLFDLIEDLRANDASSLTSTEISTGGLEVGYKIDKDQVVHISMRFIVEMSDFVMVDNLRTVTKED